MMPIVDGIEAEFGGQITVRRLNAAEASVANLQAKWDLRGHPAFAILDGQEQIVTRFFGPQETETLRRSVTGVIGS